MEGALQNAITGFDKTDLTHAETVDKSEVTGAGTVKGEESSSGTAASRPPPAQAAPRAARGRGRGRSAGPPPRGRAPGRTPPRGTAPRRAGGGSRVTPRAPPPGQAAPTLHPSPASAETPAESTPAEDSTVTQPPVPDFGSSAEPVPDLSSLESPPPPIVSETEADSTPQPTEPEAQQQPGMADGGKNLVRAVYEWGAREKDELSFQPGDLINLMEKDDSGWWKGELNGNIGVFPNNYVEEIPDDEKAALVAAAVPEGGMTAPAPAQQQQTATTTTAAAATGGGGVSITGNLTKQGHVRKNWKLRYFILDGSTLKYFASNVDQKKPKGEIPITPTCVIEKWDEKPNGFSIVGDAKPYFMYATSNDERQRWMDALNNAKASG